MTTDLALTGLAKRLAISLVFLALSFGQAHALVPSAAAGFSGLASQPAPFPTGDEVETLLNEIREKGGRVDVKVFHKLGRLKTQAAFDALVEGVTLISSDFDEYDDAIPILQAYDGFEYFKGVPKLESQAIDYLIEEIEEKEFTRVLSASGSLKVYGDTAEGPIRKAISKNKKKDRRAMLLRPLIPTLIKQGDAKALTYLLEHFQITHTASIRTLKKFLSEFKPEGLGKPLKKALDDKKLGASVLLALVEGLGAIPGGDIHVGLTAGLSNKDDKIVAAALEALRARGDLIKPTQLRKLSKSKSPGVRFAAYLGLAGETDSKDHGKWMERIVRGVEAKDADEQMAALDTLETAASPIAIEALCSFLKHRQNSIRGATLEHLLECRSLASLPALIEYFGWESDSKLRTESYAVLKKLTGLDWGNTSARWQRWWDKEGATFTLPGAFSARVALRKKDRKTWEEKERYSLFGLKIESTSAVFVIDASNSMRDLDGGVASRMDEAKRQLSAALKVYPVGAHFNIIFFGSDLAPFEEDLVEMTEKVRKKALSFVKRQRLIGHTALYDALQLAFEHEQADTIYLLSDGVPSGGTIDNVSDIRKEARLWNRGRKPRIQVHCISMGSSLSILKYLAKDTKGQYFEFL